MNTSLKIVITLLLAILLLSSCRQAISNKKPRILLIHSFQEDRYNYKIFIIDKADTLTVQAQNALLKTLEEPPKKNV